MSKDTKKAEIEGQTDRQTDRQPAKQTDIQPTS